MAFRHVTRVVLASALALSVACGHDMTSIEWNGVSVTVQSGGLAVQNSNDVRLGVFAVNLLKAADIQWSKCSDVSDSCLRVPAGGNYFIPFADVVEYDSHAEISVYTWTVTNGQVQDVAVITVTQ